MSGICPASDGALWEQLTALEHVVMVAQIKGVSDRDIATTEARVILHALGLSKDEQEVARILELSQGVRRRVSVAMALAGLHAGWPLRVT
jgi:ABC-type multidrug transport system ATPase subunit